MIYYCWVLLLIAEAVLLSQCFQQKTELCFAPAICLNIVLMYLSGLLGNLLLGVYVCAGFGIICGVLCCAGAIRFKKDFFIRSITPGLLLTVLLFVYVGWARKGSVVIGNDEFSHWAYTVKMMFYHNTLSPVYGDEMLFASYPPAASLWELLFIRLTPHFTESYLYRALDVFQISFLVPLVTNFKWKQAGKAAVALAAAYILPIVIYPEFYNDLCVDGLLALQFCYILILSDFDIQKDQFHPVALGLVSACVTLTKESGIFFVLTAAAFLIIPALTEKKQGSAASEKIHTLFPAGVMLASAAVAEISWKIFLDITETDSGGSGGLLKNLLYAFTSKDERVKVTVSAFLRKLLIYPEQDAPLRLSVFAWAVAAAVIVSLSLYLLKAKSRYETVAAVGLPLGFGAYCFGLLYLYLFSFGEYEGTRVYSFWRYIGSYLLAYVLFALYLLLKAFTERKSLSAVGTAALLLAALLVFPFNTRQVNQLVSPETESVQDQSKRSAYPSDSNFPVQLSQDDRVYFIAEDTAVYEKLCAAYSMYPYRCDSSVGYNFDAKGENAMYASDIDASALENALLDDGYTYLFLYSISDSFISRFGALFENAEDIVPGGYYRVEENNGSVLLKRI